MTAKVSVTLSVPEMSVVVKMAAPSLDPVVIYANDNKIQESRPSAVAQAHEFRGIPMGGSVIRVDVGEVSEPAPPAPPAPPAESDKPRRKKS